MFGFSILIATAIINANVAAQTAEGVPLQCQRFNPFYPLKGGKDCLTTCTELQKQQPVFGTYVDSYSKERFTNQVPFKVDDNTFVFGAGDSVDVGYYFMLASVNALGQKQELRYINTDSRALQSKQDFAASFKAKQTFENFTVALWNSATKYTDSKYYTENITVAAGNKCEQDGSNSDCKTCGCSKCQVEPVYEEKIKKNPGSCSSRLKTMDENYAAQCVNIDFRMAGCKDFKKECGMWPQQCFAYSRCTGSNTVACCPGVAAPAKEPKTCRERSKAMDAEWNTTCVNVDYRLAECANFKNECGWWLKKCMGIKKCTGSNTRICCPGVASMKQGVTVALFADGTVSQSDWIQ